MICRYTRREIISPADKLDLKVSEFEAQRNEYSDKTDSSNVRRQRAERLRTKNMEQPETSNEANDSDRPNDVARLRCTPLILIMASCVGRDVSHE